MQGYPGGGPGAMPAAYGGPLPGQPGGPGYAAGPYGPGPYGGAPYGAPYDQVQMPPHALSEILSQSQIL